MILKALAPSTMLGFMDEMSKIAEYRSTCKRCGAKKDLRMGYCFDCATKAEKRKTAGFMANVGSRIANTAKTVGGAVGGALSKGWHYGSDVPGKGWLGTGAQISEAMKKPGVMNALGRGFEHATSLGGATKYLPVGTKSLTLIGGAMDLHQGLKKEDPTGQGRSRVERLSGAAGGTLAGLAASPLGLKALPIGMAAGWAAGRLGRAISPRKTPNQLPTAPAQVVQQPPRTSP